MALAIYKPGQGYWTRMLSAVGLGTLVLSGAGWLWQIFQGDPWSLAANDILSTQIQQAVVAITVIAGFSVFGFWIFNKPSIVDFMISTEAEMKKVNWPGRREIFLSTVIVIAGTLLIAIFLFIADMIFKYFFTQIGVLYGLQ